MSGFDDGKSGLSGPSNGDWTGWRNGEAQRVQDQFHADLAKRNREEQSRATEALFKSSPPATAGGAPGTVGEAMLFIGVYLLSYLIFFLILGSVMGAGPLAWIGLMVSIAALVILVGALVHEQQRVITEQERQREREFVPKMKPGHVCPGALSFHRQSQRFKAEQKPAQQAPSE